MAEGDVRYETWWNSLTQERRTDILKLIPAVGAEQQELFSQRLWHELHDRLRDDIRRHCDNSNYSAPTETFQDLIDNGLRSTPHLDPALQPLPANLRGIPVTFASMIMTDGKTTHIGVYRGVMVGALGKRYINYRVATTVHIATEVVTGGDHVSDVNRLCSEYATADWPAVDWSR